MTERDNKSVKHLEPIARFGRLEISRIAVHQLFTNTLKDADIRISMDGRGRWMDNFALPGNMLKYGPRSSRIGICLGIPGIRAKALVCERALRPVGFIESCVSGWNLSAHLTKGASVGKSNNCRPNISQRGRTFRMLNLNCNG